jgi:aspartokinase
MARAADNRRNIKLSPILYDKVSDIVKKENNKGNTITIYSEVNNAVEKYVAEYNQEEIINTSKIEQLLEEKISKHDKHIASMLGRTGIDVAMILIGISDILIRFYKDDDEFKSAELSVQDIIKVLRTDGVRYFSNK